MTPAPLKETLLVVSRPQGAEWYQAPVPQLITPAGYSPLSTCSCPVRSSNVTVSAPPAGVLVAVGLGVGVVVPVGVGVVVPVGVRVGVAVEVAVAVAVLVCVGVTVAHPLPNWTVVVGHAVGV